MHAPNALRRRLIYRALIPPCWFQFINEARFRSCLSRYLAAKFVAGALAYCFRAVLSQHLPAAVAAKPPDAK